MKTKVVEDGISELTNEELAILFPEPAREEGKHRFMAGTCVDWGHPLDEICTANLQLEEKPAAVPEAPTFAYQLAMHLTRNGADAPHMQAEINRFLYEGKWQTTQGAK